MLDVYKIILDLNNILITLHTDPYTNLFTMPNALFWAFVSGEGIVQTNA